MHIPSSAVETHTPTRWNLIGHNLTAPLPVFITQQYSSVTLLSLCFHPREQQSGALSKNIFILIF
jgi:hypothetical protein